MEPFDWEQGTRSHLSFEFMIKSNVARVTKRPVATEKIWAESLCAAHYEQGGARERHGRRLPLEAALKPHDL